MRWCVSGLTWLGGLLCLLLGCSRPSVVSQGPPWKLEVLRLGQLVKELDRSALQQLAAPENVTLFDPYYARQKRFVALPLEPILEAALGEPLAALRQRDFMLRAQDGYAVPLPGSRLLEGGAMLAVADLEVPAWEPIGPQRVNPGPLYLVWKHAHQTQQESHPRPWQLARIELVDAAQLYPHAMPSGLLPDSEAARGFALFRQRCIRCHAVNREGGRVGPELNVPQNILEYRPAAQVRAYIRSPLTFRYGNMPTHLDLSEAQLDDLLGYFEAMRTRKHDPDAQGPSAAAAKPERGL
ncbi:MAG: cytochrome c [Deltaproteobacteria bacterium]|nr:cytochrome c [Deltaproteobacteria bacterium]